MLLWVGAAFGDFMRNVRRRKQRIVWLYVVLLFALVYITRLFRNYSELGGQRRPVRCVAPRQLRVLVWRTPHAHRRRDDRIGHMILHT